jgi:hypothetical protein
MKSGPNDHGGFRTAGGRKSSGIMEVTRGTTAG